MLRRIGLFSALTFLSALLLCEAASSAADAADEKTPDIATLDAKDYQDPAKFSRLMKDREELLLKMHSLRVKLINDDPALQKLHRQIMALHKELSIEIDSRKDMKKLLEKLKDIDSDIDRIPRKDNR